MRINIRGEDRVCICGQTGKGKTTLAKYLAAIYKSSNDILIYDPLDQYRMFKIPNERYKPPNNEMRYFNAICHYLCNVNNTTFIVEEAEMYLRQGRELSDDAFEVVFRGRNWGIGICAITRRIQRVSKDFFDMCQHIIFFKCGVQSRDYIAEKVGKEVLSRIMSLKPYEFLYYNVEDESYTVTKLNLGRGSLDTGKPEENDEARQERAIRTDRAPGARLDSPSENSRRQSDTQADGLSRSPSVRGSSSEARLD